MDSRYEEVKQFAIVVEGPFGTPDYVDAHNPHMTGHTSVINPPPAHYTYEGGAGPPPQKLSGCSHRGARGRAHRPLRHAKAMGRGLQKVQKRYPKRSGSAAVSSPSLKRSRRARKVQAAPTAIRSGTRTTLSTRPRPGSAAWRFEPMTHARLVTSKTPRLCSPAFSSRVAKDRLHSMSAALQLIPRWPSRAPSRAKVQPGGNCAQGTAIGDGMSQLTQAQFGFAYLNPGLKKAWEIRLPCPRSSLAALCPAAQR